MNFTNSTIINKDENFAFIYTSCVIALFVFFLIFVCLKNEYNEYINRLNKNKEILI